MNQNLITIENEEPVVSTLVLAEGFQIENRSIVKLIQKHESFFQKRRGISILNANTSEKGGKPQKYCTLNEDQTIFLMTLLRNSEVAVLFKDRLAEEFSRMKKVLNGSSTSQPKGVQEFIDRGMAAIEIFARILNKGIACGFSFDEARELATKLTFSQTGIKFPKPLAPRSTKNLSKE